MIKAKETLQEGSCFNRARLDETLFVLLGRDAAAPTTIRFWVSERLRLGKNAAEDEQIKEALECALAMDREQVSK